jgi:hypothetical protein
LSCSLNSLLCAACFLSLFSNTIFSIISHPILPSFFF